MPEGYWVVRTYEAGNIGEKTKFWVPGRRPEKQTRREKAELKKQEQNEHAAEKQLARLINDNFGPGDLLMGLDYSEEGMKRITARAEQNLNQREEPWEDIIREAAEQEARLLLRRVKRELAKQGTELKYIVITSDMDGDTGEAVRVHHHLIVPAGVQEIFAEKWAPMGGVNWEKMSDQQDYTPIAAYFIRQVRRIPDAKKYISSRNLSRPRPKDRVALTEAELRVPRGGELLHRSEFKPGRPQYIRYVLPEGKRRRKAAGNTGEKVDGSKHAHCDIVYSRNNNCGQRGGAADGQTEEIYLSDTGKGGEKIF